jgi:hypothetical protein
MALLTPVCADDLEKLGFLSGCWAFESGALRVEEQWNRPAGGIMLGASRTLKGGRAVFHEFLRIDVKEGAVQYTPQIGSTAKPVTFRLTTLGENEAVFENLQHDFPQRIIYRKSAEGLPVRIEGTVNGALRKQDFPYRRMECP